MNVLMNFSALNVTRSTCDIYHGPHTTFIFLIETPFTLNFFPSLLDYGFLICDAV